MPDAGNFDNDRHAQGTPPDWAGAFAALPQEIPEPDGWQRLQTRLPAAPRRERTRWPVWLATAASLAVAFAIPLRMPSTTNVFPAPAASVVTPPPDTATKQPAADAGIEVVAGSAASGIDDHPGSATAKPIAASATARAPKPRRSRDVVPPSRRPLRTAAQAADTTRIAGAEAADVPLSDTSLESLYAQSARLEGLLALARDDRVSTGTAAALADTLNARVAGIDAALAQPDLDPQRRQALWRDRVDSLRQLVGIETTQRLYAARGQQYDAALVSID